MEHRTRDQEQFTRMTTVPIPKLIGAMAIPTIISMMVTSIYNMADTFFVSKLGTSATGAVGIVFSLMAIIQAVGFMLGMGAGANVSRLLGQQKEDEAGVFASTAFFTALAFGLALTVVGLAGIDPLMELLGATETILPYARAYASYILFGAPVMCASFVLNNTLRSQGKAVFSMVGIGLGGVLNIVLDPIFIFVFELGIAGAAIATLISQCISFAVLLSFYLLGRTSIRLSPRKISRQGYVYSSIFKTGLPSLCRQGLASISTVSLNRAAALYGDPAVAAMSVVGRIFMFILSVMLGFGQGFQPVAGYNYGAQRYDRVKEAFRFTLGVGVVLLGTIGLVGFFFAPQAMALFRKDDLEVIAIGSLAMRAQCLSMPLMALITSCNMLFQTTGKSGQATFLACSRQGIFFLPLIYLLPQLIGLLGVQLTQTLADICTALCCVPMLIYYFKELNGKIAQQAAEQ